MPQGVDTGIETNLREHFPFFRRDLRIARNYAHVILETVEALFGRRDVLLRGAGRGTRLRCATLFRRGGKTYSPITMAGFVFFEYLTAALDYL